MFVDLTTEYIESAMSPSLYASYDQWLQDNSGKAGRLDDIISHVLSEYRSAMVANGAPVPSTPAAIHESCVRHAQTTILFELKKEIGLSISEAENAAAIRADVFLRAVWMGSILITRDTEQPSPSYVALAASIEEP